MATNKKFLFVDANIWLDFYRTRTDAGLSLLRHLETIADRIIVTYQLEMEVKKNRQTVIIESLQGLKPPQHISRPALFSDAAAVRLLDRSIKQAERSVKKLKDRLLRALSNPAAHDPVYQIYQRIFHKEDDLVLTHEDKIRHIIRHRAFRRFIHGCPPRKKNDTSIGDSINWEWMVECAAIHKAELVILSRDSDFGITYQDKSYINDHLRQEFSERVSQKRNLLLYSRLSKALEHFAVSVTSEEQHEEEQIIQATKISSQSKLAAEEVDDEVLSRER